MKDDGTSLRVFYAYPSVPASAVDAAGTAVADLERTGLVSIRPWDRLFINGRPIPSEVMAAINDADAIIADLTGLNANVLYEIGYAVGRNKKIWLAADLSRTSREAIGAGVPPLGTMGIFGYNNGHQLAAGFESEFIKLVESPAIISGFRAPEMGAAQPSIMLMKSLHDTDASVRVMDRFANSSVPLVLDDPTETNARSLVWYFEKLVTSPGIVVHFTAADRAGALAVNARYSLIAGMARGLGTNTLLLQEKSVAAVPLDFREDVRTYISGREASAIVGEWVTSIERDHEQLVAKLREDEDRTAKRASLQVLHRGIGDFVAENDRDLISDYFIATAAYLNALESTGPIIFVGRKGTGKTANLLKLADELGRSVNNLVCTIKPAGYDIAALAEALQDIASDPARERSMVALWKYLLFTEIVVALARDYEKKLDAQLPTTADENALWELAYHEGWLESTFAERLTLALDGDAPLQERVESLYREKVAPTIVHAASALRSKNRVTVLLDNIDKSWSRESDFLVLSRFLLSLLVAAGDLHSMLERKMRNGFELSTIVFVRSDIFEHIKRVAREPDKLPIAVMKWNDKELLMRVVDERLRAATAMPAPETWRRYFVPEVDGKSTREYIVSRILPRPRDVIVFVKAAIASAVNRGHDVVNADDLSQAESDYSSYALDSIKVENLPVAVEMEEVLIQLMYGEEVITSAEFMPKLEQVGMDALRRTEIIDLLVASSVLGREVEDDRFDFAEDLPAARALALRARKFGEKRRLGSRFRVHVAFHKILDIR